MRPILILMLLFTCFFAPAQKIYLRDWSAGYRIGEGEAVGSNPYTLGVYLKKPAAYQAFLNSFEVNSIYGNPGPVTYHRIFLQTELAKKHTAGSFWKKTTIPLGINFAFREKRTGMAIEYNEQYARPITDSFVFNKFTIEQTQKFVGLHTGISRRFRISSRIGLLSGIFLQGEMAIRHRFPQQLSFGLYRIPQTLISEDAPQLSDLKGRNYVQWAILVPFATEINIYKKQWLLKPEVSIGMVGNRYLSKTFYARESINAALWFIYRRK